MRGMRAFPLCALVLLCSFVVSPVVLSAQEEEEMRWDKAESEVGHDRYSQAYIDSVKNAKGVGDQRGIGETQKLPFTREKLVFDGGWGFIRAGFAILTAEPDTTDPSIINFVGKVVSNNFVSTFYRVRDYVHSHNDARTLWPLFFEQHVQEGRYQDHRWTLFDHRGHKVYYHYKKGEKEADALPGIHNYLSVLYQVRTRGFAVGDTFSIRCYYHRKDYPIKFKVHKKETIEVDAGTFRCWRIEPQLRGEGRGFTKKDKLLFWLTDDERKMPVLIKAKVNIGSLSAKLQHFEIE